MRYVLDASIAIAALNGVPAVRARLATVPGSEVGQSVDLAIEQAENWLLGVS